MTWVDNEILTSAQLNLHLRDNLLETMPAKTSATSTFLVSDANNNLVERTAAADYIDNGLENVSSSEWGDIDSIGPRVTRVTGPRVLVIWSCQYVLGSGVSGESSLTSSVGLASIAISPVPEEGSEEDIEEDVDEEGGGGDGEDAFEPHDDHALMRQNTTAAITGDIFQGSHHLMIHDLFEPDEEATSGEYVFTMKYRRSGTRTLRVRRRSLFVWPLS
jgi:hypothetical protein